MIKLVDDAGEVLDLNAIPGFGIQWTRNMQGTATFASNYKKVPNYDTVLYLGTDYGFYKFDIVLTTSDMDLENLSQTNDLINSFVFNEEGEPKRLRMYFEYEVYPERRFRVGRLEKASEISLGENFHNLTLSFMTEDRYAYGDTEFSMTKTVSNLSPEGVHVTMTPQVSGVSVAPEITITGDANGLFLNSKERVISVGDIDAEAVYKLDLIRYRATKGTENIFVRIPLRYTIGKDGIFIKGTSGNVAITFKWRNRYI